MENDHFPWENPLEIIIFHSHRLVITRGYSESFLTSTDDDLIPHPVHLHPKGNHSGGECPPFGTMHFFGGKDEWLFQEPELEVL